MAGKCGCDPSGGFAEDGPALHLEALICGPGVLVVLFGCGFKSSISLSGPAGLAPLRFPTLFGLSTPVLCCRGNGQESQRTLYSFSSWFLLMASSYEKPAGVTVGCRSSALGIMGSREPCVHQGTSGEVGSMLLESSGPGTWH